MNYEPTPSPVRDQMLPLRRPRSGPPPEVEPLRVPEEKPDDSGKYLSLRARPEAGERLIRMARERDLKVVAVVDLLLRGWDLLTHEQRETAFRPDPQKSGGAQ